MCFAMESYDLCLNKASFCMFKVHRAYFFVFFDTTKKSAVLGLKVFFLITFFFLSMKEKNIKTTHKDKIPSPFKNRQKKIIIMREDIPVRWRREGGGLKMAK